MAKHTAPAGKPTLAQKRLNRSNRAKAVRTVLEIAALVVLIVLAVIAAFRSAPKAVTPVNGAGTLGQPRVTAGAIDTANGLPINSGRFIAVSYPGLTKSTSLESKIVNQAVFQEQIAALKASGYQTISQEDIANYYLYFGTLPEKSLYIIFEDGLLNTTSLAQETLLENGYSAAVSSYANNLDDLRSKYLTTPMLKALLNVGCWETATSGYRLSYINIFDRYANFFGELNAEEFVKVHEYLWRDYNHYLMDFIRDEDRLRTETEAELRARIAQDYNSLRAAYTNAIGYVPSLYLLMHSNTGAFGTDAIASDANREHITSIFTMNVNREGTCLNNLESSIYDLSRLQVQSYFSTNHLLMRIWDDTGDELKFLTGDETEASHWYQDDGVAQYKGNKILLTSEPRGRGQITLNARLFSDLDMTVTLQGNLVGRQSICLRTDRNWEHGIEIALDDNNLIVNDLGDGGKELFFQSLFEFDGGPFISTQEDEYNGLVALQKAIIELDEDPLRIAKAREKLAELEVTPVLTLADGGTPYYPENDTTERGNRKLRIRLIGSRLSVWVDDKPCIDQLKVSGVQLGSLSLGAEVYRQRTERFTQRNIYDDVYDAVFTDLVIRDPQNEDTVLYEYRLSPDQTINSIITGWFNTVIDFFSDHF
ncbi:MAG: hypothetical protein GX418_10875 [Clostridiales bacterium]|nr:hypothetical protein [Clostridiales bacterium]